MPASIYYAIFELGFGSRGYNIIHTTGKITRPSDPFIVFKSIHGKNKTTPELFQKFPAGFNSLSFYIHNSSSLVCHQFSLICVLQNTTIHWSWSLTVVLKLRRLLNPKFQENFWLIAVGTSLLLPTICEH
jgi:hypothetical protein